MLFDFEVKSYKGPYKVFFISNSKKELQNLMLDKKNFILIDNNIKRLYPGLIDDSLNSNIIEVVATEEAKSYSGLIPIIQQLLDKRIKKDSLIIAIGGGVVQDVASFIGSIILRGVSWVFFPTTLLAQGDSCIGSKTSINFGEYKNQIGNFYPPKSIYIDCNFLETLPRAEIYSGIGEMCHYFLLKDITIFEKFMNLFDSLPSDDAMQEMINLSLNLKKEVIEIDEFDQNERILFNYGHSFGHALESIANYSVPHGVAVAYGMDMANFVSMKLNLITKDQFLFINKFLIKIFNGFSINCFDLDAYIEALKKDKKNEGEYLGLILTEGIGKMKKTLVSCDQIFLSWIREYIDLNNSLVKN